MTNDQNVLTGWSGAYPKRSCWATFALTRPLFNGCHPTTSGTINVTYSGLKAIVEVVGSIGITDAVHEFGGLRLLASRLLSGNSFRHPSSLTQNRVFKTSCHIFRGVARSCPSSVQNVTVTGTKTWPDFHGDPFACSGKTNLELLRAVSERSGDSATFREPDFAGSIRPIDFK